MARWLVNNIGLMLLALVFGFGAWALSTLQDNPIVDGPVAFRVIKINESQLSNVTWSGTLPVSVTAMIRAPRSTLEELRASNLHIDVDLSGLHVGTNLVSLTPTLKAEPAFILSSQPMTALVTIEQLAQLRLPVRISVIGTPALGFRAGTPTMIPQQVVITGSQQVISRIVSANAIVSVDGARASVEQEVQAFARDGDGEIVPGAQLSPNSVSVRVPMEQLSNYRDLAVLVKRRGQPADGYAVSDVSVEPVIVTIYGPVEAVQDTKGYIETLEVVIDGAKSDIDEQVGLDVPSNVSLVSEKQTTVRVHIGVQPLKGTRTVKRKPVLIGMTSNFSSTISPDIVDILLDGPLPRLNNLMDNDVLVEVDVTGLAAGVHQLTPVIRVPEGISVQSVLPATIQVELKPINAVPTRNKP